MRCKNLLASTSLVSALAWLTFMPAPSIAQTAVALTGQVASAEEGAMEGVLVSAKREGATITTTVVSDDKGRFSFPADRLAPGRYNITIRAAGYNLVGPKAIDVAPGAPATADLKLAKTNNVAAQLSNTEWLQSVPGDDRIKSFLPDCVNCHTLQRVFTSPHSVEEWKNVFMRMGRYSPLSVPARPQPIVSGGPRSERPRVPAAMLQAAADFLFSVNLSNPDHEEYSLKRLPRPKGRATRVIITEYDLARKEALPHDVVVDPDGHAWYSDFGGQFVGELDPKTGKVTDYALPLLREDQPKGSLNLELDPDGNLWLGLAYQAGVAKVDRKTKVVTAYPLPKEWTGITTQTNMASATHMDVDGKVWTGDSEAQALYRLDVKSGQWENMGHATDPSGKTIEGYGKPVDKDNNVYLLEYGNTRIGRVDAKTNVAQAWATPTPAIASAPRPLRRPGPSLVRGVRRQCHRHVRPRHPADQGMEGADRVERALRRGAHPIRRRGLGRLDALRPGRAPLPQDRRDRRISVAALDQHPARLRAGHHAAAGAVGRQQPRRRHHQAGAAGLGM